MVQNESGSTGGFEAGEALKRAFREHPAGIGVITAQTPEGPVGLTVSSVASVAVDPPAIAFSVTRATGSAGGVLHADTFLVHLVDSRHASIAQSFAVTGAERFTPEQGWTTLPTGEPYLPNVRAALRCRALHTLEVGSSVIVVAGVLDAHFAESADPMVYLDRQFRGLGDPL
ncbi:flavin reductase family protein [Leucobacter denitrificans]|uniref:flavin reductase family protein n=1 Tax=Leucobacter denitrificans TaxID=683042 RepID=UPI00360A37A8